jgi:hypothetical protein
VRLELLALTLCGCRAIAPEPTDDPDPPLASDAASVDAATVDAAAAPSTTPPPLAYNCQAPLHAIEEIARLLTVAATHATKSAACVDGPGRRIAIDEILVCPTTGSGGATMGFAATYRVTEFGEGGRGYCQPECPQPKVGHARLDVELEKTGTDYTLRIPKTIPGLPRDATPVDQAHDGDCYGKSRAFSPQPIAL